MTRTLISTSGLSKFGNMTSGGALSAIFDADSGTTGYRQATTGYAGVSFLSPQVIHSVDVVSPSNGYDASGSTTQITLRLYAKTGPTPSSDTDGTLLAEMIFTDVNTAQTKTLESNASSAWDHVWVRATSGVWVVFAEMKPFAPDSVPAEPPAPSSAPRPVYTRRIDTVTPLMWSTSEVTEFRTSPIAIGEDGVAEVDFHCDCVHRGDVTGYNGAVGIGQAVVYRYAAEFGDLESASWVEIPGAKGGYNISERSPEHYGHRSLAGALDIQAGFYQFSVRMSAHATGSPQNGLAAVLAENGVGFNNLRIAINRGGELLAA